MLIAKLVILYTEPSLFKVMDRQKVNLKNDFTDAIKGCPIKDRASKTFG